MNTDQNTNEPEEMNGCTRTIVVFLSVAVPIAVAALINYINR